MVGLGLGPDMYARASLQAAASCCRVRGARASLRFVGQGGGVHGRRRVWARLARASEPAGGGKPEVPAPGVAGMRCLWCASDVQGRAFALPAAHGLAQARSRPRGPRR
jgi:hypothetical protein